MNKNSLTPEKLSEVIVLEFAIPYLFCPLALAIASGHTEVGKLAIDYAQT